MLRYAYRGFVLLMFPAMIFAGDEATLNFIGFSHDGNHLAFEQFGWYDGSGFPYSEIVFIDVIQNSFVGSPVSVTLDEEEWEESASARTLDLAKVKLGDLNITTGNTGYCIVSQIRGEPHLDPHFVRFSEANIPLDSLGGYFRCVLTLTEIEVKDTSDYTVDFGTPKMLELSISIPGIQEEYVLQKDTKLPIRRGHVLSYHIAEVYLYKHGDATYIAVFISYATPGFEGPDIRYMGVTGRLSF